MEAIVVVLVLLALAAGILWYLIRAKKRGEKCVGCPYAKQCGTKRNGCCSGKSGNPYFHNRECGKRRQREIFAAVIADFLSGKSSEKS